MEATQSSVNMSSSSFTPKDLNSTLYTQITDESFITMEQNCIDELEFNELLGSQKVPDLNDTLDEINFILELGKKLNLEEKLMTPDSKREVSSASGSSCSFKTAPITEKLEESANEDVSFLIDESEILELKNFKKSPKHLNDTTRLEDISEPVHFDMSKDQANDTILIDNSITLDDSNLTVDESFNSNLSEHGSEGDQSDESTIEDDDNCSEVSEEEISVIDLDDDSVIEILDESLV